MNHPLRPYVLVGCARSGTTSLARILGSAANGDCAIEPTPNLNVETRSVADGQFGEIDDLLKRTVVGRLSRVEPNRVYGEKNVTYAPFLQRIQALSDCRIVFIHRDGRDVVRSLINWHDRKFGSIYRECAEAGTLVPAAISAAAGLPTALDSSDYSRPRPPRHTELGQRWHRLSRLEMCSYYWSKVNDQYLDALAEIESSHWLSIDYTHPDTTSVLGAAGFLGLRGLNADKVANMLDQRINSLSDRGEPELDGFAHWTEWNGGQRRRFEELAGGTMYALEYWRTAISQWRPRGYGEVWSQKAADVEWYEWMFDGRRKMHEAMLAWLDGIESRGDRIESVIDFGCGLGVGYGERLAEKRYVGLDISPLNIEWCREHRSNPRHAYYCLDMIADERPESADLVFSSGTIDNVYDIDRFLEAMVAASRKWVYLTCYRGWFDSLEEHTYRYNSEHACFYNDVSVDRVIEKLTALGCTDIKAYPIRSGNREIPFEACFAARVPGASKC